MNCYNCSICEKAYSTNYLKLIFLTDNKLSNFNEKTSLLMEITIKNIWTHLNKRFPEVEDNNMDKIKTKLWESIYTDSELNSCVCRVNSDNYILSL